MYQIKRLIDPTDEELTLMGEDGYRLVSAFFRGDGLEVAYLQRKVKASDKLAVREGNGLRYYVVKAWTRRGDWKDVYAVDASLEGRELERELESVCRGYVGVTDFEYIRTYYETPAPLRKPVTTDEPPF